MSNRAQRRAAARSAAPIPEPGAPFPSLAQMTANRANGEFKLFPTEDAAGFAALQKSLMAEYEPSTETESILVNAMAESHWLANRAQRLTDSCFHPETGEIANQKMFALYLRYQTTHARAFHKSLNDLLKLRAEKRKAEIGFEAQERKNEQQRIQTERHEMKKQAHYWDVLLKDAKACHQIALNSMQTLDATQQHPGFAAQIAADLAKLGLKRDAFNVATPAA